MAGAWRHAYWCSLPDSELASLIEPDGPYATAFLLTTNYRAILDYNCSNFYAISWGFWRTPLPDDRQGPPHLASGIWSPSCAVCLVRRRLSVLLASPRQRPRRNSTRRPRWPSIDLSSGAILYAKNADVRMPPASMAKMMTTDVAFELIDSGKLPLSKMCTVRPETWQKWHGPQADRPCSCLPTSRSASKTC